MKLTLSSHVVAQVVGGELLLLDSTTQSVYSLAVSDVVDHSDDFRSLTVSSAAAGFAVSLCEAGLATTTTSGLSRRALVGTGGAAVGAGLLALSLPTAAAASSPGGASGPTINVSAGGITMRITIPGDFTGALNASLNHTLPTDYVSQDAVATPFVFSDPTRTAWQVATNDANRPSSQVFTFTLRWEISGVADSFTGSATFPG